MLGVLTLWTEWMSAHGCGATVLRESKRRSGIVGGRSASGRDGTVWRVVEGAAACRWTVLTPLRHVSNGYTRWDKCYLQST